MRCDLHVHTHHSGMCTLPLLHSVCRESYSEPGSVYETLKERGMDLVTVTDHDSIAAMESLRRHPDFLLSEEVSATTPRGTRLHMGVYDIQERDHVEIQRRCDDLMSLIAYLGEQQIFFTINHAYSSLTGPRTQSDFDLFARHFPGIEALNGQIPAACNRRAADLARRGGRAVAGGSDAHTLTSLGRTYTQVPGARTKREFLDGLRSGRGWLHGESGSYWKLTRAIWRLGSEMMREQPWTLCLLPFAMAVPLVTAVHCLRELAFASKWTPRTSAPRQPADIGSGRWPELQRYPEAGL